MAEDTWPAAEIELFGVFFYILYSYYFVSGNYPFMGETLFQLYDIIGQGDFEMPSGLSEALEDLICGKHCCIFGYHSM